MNINVNLWHYHDTPFRTLFSILHGRLWIFSTADPGHKLGMWHGSGSGSGARGIILILMAQRMALYR